MSSIIYCRVSTKLQNQGVSLDAQEAACVSFCDKNGWYVIKVVREVANASKRNTQRKLSELIDKIETGELQADYLVVFSVSRFSRNVEWGLGKLRILHNNGVQLKSVTESLDASLSDGLFEITTLLNNAEYESRVISERIKSTINYKKGLGFKFGRAPFGKKVTTADSNGITLRTFETDRAEKNVIRFIKLTRRPGTSIDKLNRALSRITDNTTPISLNRGTRLEKSLTLKNVAKLLNQYGVLKRGKIWTTASITSVLSKKINF